MKIYTDSDGTIHIDGEDLDIEVQGSFFLNDSSIQFNNFKFICKDAEALKKLERNYCKTFGNCILTTVQEKKKQEERDTIKDRMEILDL